MGLFNIFGKQEKENKSAKANNSELAKIYENKLKNYRDNISNISAKAKTYIKDEDYSDPMLWMDALAICDVALEKELLDDSIKELYRQIYGNSWNKHVSMKFNEVDYDYWFKLNENINDRFIAAKHYRAYAEQADLYSSSRRPYRNPQKEKEYYQEGIKKGDATSMGCYGYNLYYGMRHYGEANKEEGLKLIKQSKELGYESADILLLHLKFYDNENSEDVLNYILSYIEKAPANKKGYYILADYYLRENNIPKAIEAMEKGVALKDRNSQYLYGMYILRGQIQDIEKAEGIKHLEQAFDYYVVHAANFLGQYYYYGNDDNSSVQKAIEWHEKAVEYYSGDSAFELGVIYSYNDQFKDEEKGLHFLNIGIKDGSHKAMSEKAYLLINKESPSEKEIAESKNLFEKAMDKGNDYAPYRLGLSNERAEFGGEPDYTKALELYELAASRGNIMGMEAAGHYYRLNYVNEDEGNAAKAIEYFNKAIERNSNYSRVELALCYETGRGVETDYKKAFELYSQAAEAGYSFANLKMGYYFEDGLMGEEDLNKALENFKIASEAGLAEATYNVGRFYRYSVGIPENPEEAYKHFKAAADQNEGQAMIEMGLIYEYEYGGCEFDAQKAMDYMLQAAEQGYSYAQYKVGYYHYYGLIEQDIAKGLEWFRKAYERGYPYAALMIGNYYLYNHGGEKEYNKALEYYKFAEEHECLNEGIGICHEFGFGTEENNTEAFKYYNLAAEKDNVAAMYRLGLCYKYGTGTTEDLAAAYNWFSKSAEEEHSNAQYEMAMMLLDGKGVGQDEAKAVELLKKTAEDDNDDAQLELGNCYLTGRGVEVDEMQAMLWYQKAAENGNEQAQKLTGKRERRRS